MENKYLLMAIMAIVPSAKCILLTDNLSDIEWLDKREMPKKEIIIDKANEFVIKEKSDEMNATIQTHLDSKAQELRYDNMMSARSYAGYENPFKDEAQKLALWASNCWVKAGETETAVTAGERDMPTIDEVLAELPAYE